MHWKPLATRTIVGLGVTGLVVAGVATGAAKAAPQAAATGTTPATSAAETALTSSLGPGPAAEAAARKHLPTTTRAGLNRLRAGGTADSIVTVTFRKGVKPASAVGTRALSTTARGHDATPRSVAAGVGAATYRMPNAEVDAFVASMKARPEVASATRANLYTPLVTPTDTQYDTLQKQYLTSISAPAGWDYGRGSAAVKIAVVDTGVDVDHPDLAGKVVDQYNTVTNTTDVTDAVGHGTFVAGVAAAATNNAQGIAGVGFNSSIIAIKVADARGEMSDADVGEGIRKAADLGAKIINISLGATLEDAPTTEAVAYAQGKGALVVASAGNSAQEGNPKIYPAATPGVLSVGATDAKGHRAFFSEHGSWVSMAAPGVGIRGTTPRTLDPALSIWTKANYDNGDGTSFSAPMVAGAAALLAARAPAATAAQLRTALVSTARGYAGFGLGKGQLDVARAMAAIVPTDAATITSPADGAAVTGTATLTATGLPKSKIAWYVDGVRVGTSASGAAFTWSTAGWADGPHTVTAGNCSETGVCLTTGPSVTVTTTTAPPTLAAPLDGATVNGWTPSLINGGGNSVYAVFVDGTKLLTTLPNPAAPSPTAANAPELNLSALPAGSHTITVANCDATGARCDSPRSAPVTVTTTAIRPIAGAVTNPAFSPNADRVKDTTTITYTVPAIASGTLSFVNPVGNVTVRSVALGAKAAGTYTYTWNGKATNGAVAPMRNYVVRIAVKDAAGVQGLATTRTRLDVTAPTATVQAGTATVFHPVIDGYRDTLGVRFALNERARVTLTVRNAKGSTVRSVSASATGKGIESIAWNGKNNAGALVPAGAYTWLLTTVDAAGMKRSTVARKVTVSRQKLKTFTKVIAKGGTTSYGYSANASCATATFNGSSYPTGLWLKNNCPRRTPAFISAFFRIGVPRAVSYSSFTVATTGRSHSQPAEVAAGIYSTQTDAYDLTYPTRKVTTPAKRTLTLGTITGPGHTPKNVADVLVYVPNELYNPLTDWDLQTVTLTVKYRALA